MDPSSRARRGILHTQGVETVNAAAFMPVGTQGTCQRADSGPTRLDGRRNGAGQYVSLGPSPRPARSGRAESWRIARSDGLVWSDPDRFGRVPDR